EAEPFVQKAGAGVGAVDVERAGGGPASGEALETGEHELAPEATALEVGVDGDDIDLAEPVTGCLVHLGPAEAGQAAVILVQEEAGRFEPGLALARLEHLACPRRLVGVAGEGAVVHVQPRLLVDAGAE